MEEQLILVKTLGELEALKDYLKDKDYVALDTETTGLDKEAQVIGFSVCAELNKAYYVILAYWDVTLQQLKSTELQGYTKDILNILKNQNIIMHNAVFDCWMIKNNFGIDLMDSVHTDTMILGHVLNENRSNALKERGVELYGEDTRTEQRLMKESVTKNGGLLTKTCFELYKADAELIGYYGAKDALLTLKLFYNDVPLLFAEELDKFFYYEESMPLLRGPTYDLNTIGLRVDPEGLQSLKATLEADCIETKAYILKEIDPYVKEIYPGTKKTNHFNISSNNHLAWLLFIKLDNEFTTLTEAGKELCTALELKIPYSNKAKRDFISLLREQKEQIWKPEYVNKKTGKKVRAKKIQDPWKYLTCGVESLTRLSKKYKWVAKLLEYKKNMKLLNTYVEGIQTRMKYNVIRPSFMQNGTTSGRYSSKNPNFQNLPREDKRVKSCIVARANKVFIGADYSQLEPRVFASFSGDKRLQACFEKGEDFYSVIGTEVFDKHGFSLIKNEPNSFAKVFPEERQLSKTFALAATYGANAFRLAKVTGKNTEEMEEILEKYFTNFPGVRELMLKSYKEVKKEGRVTNLFGRPRRLPEALKFETLYGDCEHHRLPYAVRSKLNLSVNHRIQSTAASIVNRASIAFHEQIKENNIEQCHIVMQIHDEVVVECLKVDSEKVTLILKNAMENTTHLPGVSLVAEPKVAFNLAELK